MRGEKRTRVRLEDKTEVLSPSEFSRLCRELRDEGGHVAAVDIVGPGGYRVAVVVRRGRRTEDRGRTEQLELGLS